MTKPSNFILNSDYATPKNDDGNTFSVTVPSGISVPGASVVVLSETKEVGMSGANLRARISSSKDGSRWFSVPTVYYDRVGSGGGYYLYATLHRVSSTQLRLSVFIPNPYGLTMSGEAGSEVISAVATTLIPPFS